MPSVAGKKDADADDDDDIVEMIEKRRWLLQWKLILQYLMLNLCTMAIVLIIVTYGLDLFHTLKQHEHEQIISMNNNFDDDTISTTGGQGGKGGKRFEPTNRTLVAMITIIAMVIFIIVFMIGIIAVAVDNHRHIMTIFLGLMVANFSGCLAVGFISVGSKQRWHFWPVSFISFTLICLSSIHVAIDYKIGRLPDHHNDDDNLSISMETNTRRLPFLLVGKKKYRKKNNYHHRHHLFETISLESIDSVEPSFNSNPSSV